MFFLWFFKVVATCTHFSSGKWTSQVCGFLVLLQLKNGSNTSKHVASLAEASLDSGFSALHHVLSGGHFAHLLGLLVFKRPSNEKDRWKRNTSTSGVAVHYVLRLLKAKICHISLLSLLQSHGCVEQLQLRVHSWRLNKCPPRYPKFFFVRGEFL